MEPYYADDFVILYHGDCRDVLAALPAVDLLLTDPPYGVNYVSNWGGRQGKRPITNDGARLALRLYKAVIPLLKADHILWFTRWDAWPDVWELLGSAFPMRGLLVWDKGTTGMGDLAHWRPNYELIASLGTAKTLGKRDGSVLRYPGVSLAQKRHPTEKPVDLLRYLIGKLPGNVVLDPFAGSGSTLVAAKSLGRRAIGVEVDERYCEIIAARCAQEVLFGDVA